MSHLPATRLAASISIQISYADGWWTASAPWSEEICTSQAGWKPPYDAMMQRWVEASHV